VQQRVAILREYDRGFVDAAEKPRERGDLRLVPRGTSGGIRQCAEEAALVSGILEAEERRPRWRLVV
jgi:hypothetical protein